MFERLREISGKWSRDVRENYQEMVRNIETRSGNGWGIWRDCLEMVDKWSGKWSRDGRENGGEMVEKWLREEEENREMVERKWKEMFGKSWEISGRLRNKWENCPEMVEKYWETVEKWLRDLETWFEMVEKWLGNAPDKVEKIWEKWWRHGWEMIEEGWKNIEKWSKETYLYPKPGYRFFCISFPSPSPSTPSYFSLNSFLLGGWR